MASNHRKSPTLPAIATVAIGAAIGIITAIIILAAAAIFTSKAVISESAMIKVTFATAAISAFIGAKLGLRNVTERKLPLSLAIAAAMCVLTLAIGRATSGVASIGGTTPAVLGLFFGGSALAGLLRKGKTRKTRRYTA